jgi:hypothetical protein
MSAEHIPISTPESNENTYEVAVKKLEQQNLILAGGDNIDQDRVDAIMAQSALAEVKAESFIDDLTIPAEEANSEDVVAEAARRQAAEINMLYAKQDLQERAARENWPEDKYQSELSKLQAS